MFRWDNVQTSFYNYDELWDILIPENSVYRLFREFAPILVVPEDLEGLYSRDNGRPSLFALRMTLACLLQQMHAASDRDMEQQTQVNLEFKYALGMGVDEPGIDAVSLFVHRQRLIHQNLDTLLLQRFIYLLYCLGILTGKEPFLTDTTHSISPISEQSSISLIQQAVTFVVRRLKKKGHICQLPNDLRKPLTQEKRWEASSLPDYIRVIDFLLQWFEQNPDLLEDDVLKSRVCCLARIMKERVIRHADSTVTFADTSTVKDMVISAYDVDARFGCKGKIHWRGYKIGSIQIGKTGFIAASDVIAANQHDGDTLAPLIDSLLLSPVEEPTVIGDSHYGAVEQRLEMQAREVKVIAPAARTPEGPTIEEEGFQVSDDLSRLTCPQGHDCGRSYEVKYGMQFHIRNTKKSPCQTCPLTSTCLGGKDRRTVFVHKHHAIISQARREENTDLFKASMNLRKQIEAKQNELVNYYGLRRTQYRGTRNLAYVARMRSLGANFRRLQRLLNSPKHAYCIDKDTAKKAVWSHAA
ncbi:transposase [Sporomusa sp.]|uniref:transposase n=1 Tax=Sporomusa sp. TaxID=2078658 RepID=UPI002C04B74A|nr:transposase [Sporomusa sp.]HWR08300.1 transposase [Sporomusa sp.]